MTLFECKDVQYAYQNRFPALGGISLAIEAGSRIALVGANGSGKSTLLGVLDGLVFPQSGTVRFAGKALTESALQNETFSVDFRRRVGLVFQNPDVQLFCPTVREDIAFGPLQLGVEPSTVEKRMEAVAKDLGIEPLLDRPPHQLSVGEKRKVAFATVLVIEPEVLLLDEPTAGLDPRTTTHLIELLHQATHRGQTIITATHDLHIVADIADTIHVFGLDRRLVASGTTEEILGNHDLLQTNNLVHLHPQHTRDHRKYHW